MVTVITGEDTVLFQLYVFIWIFPMTYNPCPPNTLDRCFHMWLYQILNIYKLMGQLIKHSHDSLENHLRNTVAEMFSIQRQFCLKKEGFNIAKSPAKDAK